MRMLKLLPVIGVVFVANIAQASPQSDWNRLFAGYSKQARAKDSAGMMTFLQNNLAPEFKFVQIDGKVLARRAFIQEQMDMVYMIKDFTGFSLTVSKFVIKGDRATSAGRFTMSGVTKPQNGSKPARMAINAAFSANYVKRDGKWLMASVTETNVKATLDGKPMPRTK